MQSIVADVPTTPRSPVDDSTSRAVDSVLHAAMTLGRAMRTKLPGDQLEPASYWVMKNLRSSSMRISELATRIQLDVSTVSRHVSQLDRSGLVVRTPDPDDRRAQRVGLTEEGRQVLDDSQARRRSVLAAGFDGWDPGDVETLDRLLVRLAAGVERAGAAASPVQPTPPLAPPTPPGPPSSPVARPTTHTTPSESA